MTNILYYILMPRSADIEFLTDVHYRQFVEILRESIKKYPSAIHAFCLMPTHYHLMIETEPSTLPEILKFCRKSDGSFYAEKSQVVAVEKNYRAADLTFYIHAVPYLAGGYTRQRTIIGTRSGASVASVWSLIQSLGTDGYTGIVKRCMYMTHWLKDQLAEIDGIETVIEPVINVLGIKPTGMTAERLAGKLRGRGYALSLFPGFLRITLMPHLSIVNLSRFLHVLEEEVSK